MNAPGTYDSSYAHVKQFCWHNVDYNLRRVQSLVIDSGYPRDISTPHHVTFVSSMFYFLLRSSLLIPSRNRGILRFSLPAHVSWSPSSFAIMDMSNIIMTFAIQTAA
jgi:hypothetical protein